LPSTISIAGRSSLRASEAGTDYSTVWITSNPEALAEIAGVEGKIHFFAMDLPHSDACFVQAYPAETAEAFCDGHNAAFCFFGKVQRSILYDNTTLAVP
jgi:transposase